MIHAFQRLGIPKTVLTDNMKSITNGRNTGGHPVWNKDYEAFMDTVASPRNCASHGTLLQKAAWKGWCAL